VLAAAADLAVLAAADSSSTDSSTAYACCALRVPVPVPAAPQNTARRSGPGPMPLAIGRLLATSGNSTHCLLPTSSTELPTAYCVLCAVLRTGPMRLCVGASASGTSGALRPCLPPSPLSSSSCQEMLRRAPPPHLAHHLAAHNPTETTSGHARSAECNRHVCLKGLEQGVSFENLEPGSSRCMVDAGGLLRGHRWNAMEWQAQASGILHGLVRRSVRSRAAHEVELDRQSAPAHPG
jgi:hypothetical protein